MTADSDLLCAYARRGDTASLAALVRRHTVWMLAFLRAMLPSPADAEDVFQESWMKVIKTADRYRGGSVRAYLAAVARRTALDHLRRTGREVSLDAEAEAAAGEIPADTPPPPEAVAFRADAEEVRRAVRALAEGPRQVLLMRIEGGLSFKEIAAELNVPLGTALTWMRTATVRLRERLGGDT